MKFVLPIISVLLLLAVVGGLAFYFGQKSTVSLQINPTPTPTQNNIKQTTPTQAQQNIQTNPNADTTIEAGGVLVFSPYSLKVPSDWTSQKETTQNSDMLTLSKAGYKIVIYQAAGGGGGCTYPGDPAQQMAQNFASFVEITNTNGFVFRRGPNGTPGGFTVCQKNASDGSFGFPTNFGNITITTPTPANNVTIAEVDAILASINKK